MSVMDWIVGFGQKKLAATDIWPGAQCIPVSGMSKYPMGIFSGSNSCFMGFGR